MEKWQARGSPATPATTPYSDSLFYFMSSFSSSSSSSSFSFYFFCFFSSSFSFSSSAAASPLSRRRDGTLSLDRIAPLTISPGHTFYFPSTSKQKYKNEHQGSSSYVHVIIPPSIPPSFPPSQHSFPAGGVTRLLILLVAMMARTAARIFLAGGRGEKEGRGGGGRLREERSYLTMIREEM